MAPRKELSRYNILKGDFTFTDEPLLFRLIICLLPIVLVVVGIWALHHWAIPVFIVKKLGSIKWLEFLKFCEGRSP
jgi:hypothetical protein